ncbi:MAG: GHMP family kinase ATP-binding protein [Anaerolineales bacterium]
MIIVQTPLRVSFFGGGTDFPDYFNAEGGCVLSCSIDKYIFVTIKQRFDTLLRIGYTKQEMVESVDEIQHDLIREALRMTGIANGIEITTMGDIPSAGSGLGSSSTVAVGALHAMYSFLGELPTAEQLARGACDIEIGILRKPIGVQDQYIAAYGGLRYFDFRLEAVRSERLQLETPLMRRLNESLMLFFTGVTRKADNILHEQKNNIADKRDSLRRLKAMVHQGRDALRDGKVDAIGELLHEAWEEKKKLASQISNGDIDALYTAARKAGAIGGKIAGAGGGGFLLLYCPPEKRESVRTALAHLRELPFQVEPDGSKVIFNYRR